MASGGGSSLRILYIEDNDQNFYLVDFILRAKGHQVIRAKNGGEGIDIASTTKVDLILLDIQLPIMDGYTTARELRKKAELAKTQIIALTSYAMPADKDKALSSGCTGYIEKPINPKTFIAQIEEYWRLSNSAEN